MKSFLDTEAAVCGHPGLPAGGRFESPGLNTPHGSPSSLSFKSGDVVKYGCKVANIKLSLFGNLDNNFSIKDYPSE